MDRDSVLKIFRDCGAILDGHFLLSSGRHSEVYLQCALVQQHPRKLEQLCAALAGKWIDRKPTVVVGPAMGGIVLAYELARQLDARAVFMERVDGVFRLRRGFSLSTDERVLVAEDIVTTGKSVKEVLDVLRSAEGTVVGVTSLICRNPEVDFGVSYEALATLEIPSFSAEECPMCRQGSQATKPGSRPDPIRES